MGAQLHPYPISSPTNLISPTINTELMIPALPHIQTHPSTSSLPKMQLQALASSSAKIFPAEQPGPISKRKCHRQTFRALSNLPDWPEGNPQRRFAQPLCRARVLVESPNLLEWQTCPSCHLWTPQRSPWDLITDLHRSSHLISEMAHLDPPHI